MSKITNPSILAFERKIDPSYGLFSAGVWAEREKSFGWPAVEVKEKSVRGTFSNRVSSKEADPLKLKQKIDKPNPQTVDYAALPADADTLATTFTVRILPGAGLPSSCNEQAYYQKLVAAVGDYKATYGFKEIARRYAANLANGRFLWRNRMGSEQIEIKVDQLVNGKPAQGWTFDSYEHEPDTFPTGGKVAELGELIAAGLTGEQHVLLQVTAYVQMGYGQEVYPSQEMVLERSSGDKSKTLFAVEHRGRKVAAFHPQKIGNAIRTIDDWHASADEVGAIPVEVYGAVTSYGAAYRPPKEKQDFYSLIDNWMLKDVEPTAEQKHYIFAVLIRGGVFGGGD